MCQRAGLSTHVSFEAAGRLMNKGGEEVRGQEEGKSQTQAGKSPARRLEGLFRTKR